jgi:hypothetical protein
VCYERQIVQKLQRSIEINDFAAFSVQTLSIPTKHFWYGCTPSSLPSHRRKSVGSGLTQRHEGRHQYQQGNFCDPSIRNPLWGLENVVVFLRNRTCSPLSQPDMRNLRSGRPLSVVSEEVSEKWARKASKAVERRRQTRLAELGKLIVESVQHTACVEHKLMPLPSWVETGPKRAFKGLINLRLRTGGPIACCAGIGTEPPAM